MRLRSLFLAGLAAGLSSAASLCAGQDHIFAFVSDFVQALHSCHWAAQVEVDPRLPLVGLVNALNDQNRKLAEAEERIRPWERDPLPSVRSAAQSLLRGVDFIRLANNANLDEINRIADRYELGEKVRLRGADRRQGLEIAAASLSFLEPVLFEPAPSSGRRRGKKEPVLRLGEEDRISLLRQLDLYFGPDLAAYASRRQTASDAAGETEPLLTALERFRLRLDRPAAAPPPAASSGRKKPKK